jgi:hypothetical protein
VADLVPIEVMISSAVSEKVGATELRTIRDRIATRLRDTQAGGTSVLRVWLSEQQGALNQDDPTWDICVAEARRCDIFVGLYTGNAGWVRDHLGIGICHAEWQAAFQATPTKTRIVLIDGPALAKVKSEAGGSPSADRRFFDDLGERWRARAATPDEIVDRACEAAWLAVIDLVRAGKGAGSRGRNLLGASLEWANLDFERRERAMLEALGTALVGDDAAGRVMTLDRPSDGLVVRPLGGAQVAFVTHAVPGPFAVPEARSSLGQPFREELQLLDDLERANAVGPIQVIAVQQNVTESQVRRFIGRPDALVAAQSFGVFASDDTAFTQALFLSNCRDPSRIAGGVSAAFEWWQLSGLERSLAKRATARTAVLRALRELSQE